MAPKSEKWWQKHFSENIQSFNVVVGYRDELLRKHPEYHKFKYEHTAKSFWQFAFNDTLNAFLSHNLLTDDASLNLESFMNQHNMNEILMERHIIQFKFLMDAPYEIAYIDSLPVSPDYRYNLKNNFYIISSK